MIFKELNITKKDKIILIAIFLFSLILNIHYINFNTHLGIYCSDVYIYLLNALYFTGININSTYTITLSPVICFLTSILFNFGIKNQLAILIITAIFAIIGNIAFYFLLKTRFNEIYSLCGVILYASFAINLTWLSNGSIDIPATSITILIVLLSILSVKNPKYYSLLFPALTIGFFIRPTVILIMPVLILHYLYFKGFKLDSKDLKYCAIGIFIGLIILAIILCGIINLNNPHFGSLGQVSQGISGSKGSTNDIAYNTDASYYLVNFLNFISSSKVIFQNRTPALEDLTINSIIIPLILTLATLLFIYKNKFKLNKNKIPAIAVLLIAILTFNHISSFITIILIFIGLLGIGWDSENKMGIVMLSWILSYLIFFSYFNIKVNRYIIPTTPALAYLILSSAELIQEKINFNKNIIPIILIVLFLIQAFSFTLCFESTDEFIAPQEMSEYIISEIPDYSNHTIGVYNQRPYNWYLGENVMGIENSDTQKIDESNITYYISREKLDLENFTLIKDIDNLYLYQTI